MSSLRISWIRLSGSHKVKKRILTRPKNSKNLLILATLGLSAISFVDGLADQVDEV